MDISKVTVIGAGAMGSGISQAFAQNGYEVIMIDVKQEFLEHGLKNIKGSLERVLKKGGITQTAMDTTLQRIKSSLYLSESKDTHFVVEAATENLELKKQLFKDLDKLCAPEVILASNTSSISITGLAAVTRAAGTSYRYAFYESCPRNEIG